MNRFMKLAIDEAQKGIRNKEGGPFGAVIVKDGEVVGRGHNKVVANNDPTAHGEMMAIRDACNRLGTFDLTGCELYTTHYPCPMCKCAIMWANINKVYYGCTVDDTAEIGFRDKDFYAQDANSYIQVDRDSAIRLSEEYTALEHTMY